MKEAIINYLKKHPNAYTIDVYKRVQFEGKESYDYNAFARWMHAQTDFIKTKTGNENYKWRAA